MKFLLLGALLCLLAEVVLWWPHTPEPREQWLQTIPAGATYRLADGRTGVTPAQMPAGKLSSTPEGSIQLDRFGYVSESVEYTKEPVRLRLSPLGWVVWHGPLWLGLAAVTAAWRLRQRGQEEVRTVGPYRIHEQVGRGASAEVYRASDRKGQLLALKWLFEHSGGTEEFTNRFQREAEICARLNHPGIVRVHAWGEQDGRLWMAQDWIDGPTLEQRPGPLKPDQLVRLISSILQALDYAHQAGVIHRDLKPSNILLRADGSPVIADFGLARSAHYATITKTETTLGTPTYMPPEQILGQGSDPRSDLYSLGCMMFWLWLGKLPFLGSDPIKTLLAHLHDPVPVMPSQPEGLAQLITEMLSKERESRPASAREVLARLQQLPG